MNSGKSPRRSDSENIRQVGIPREKLERDSENLYSNERKKKVTKKTKRPRRMRQLSISAMLSTPQPTILVRFTLKF